MQSGGRWNSRGLPMVYTASSKALCVAGMAVHTSPNILSGGWVLVTIDIPDEIRIEVLDITMLPDDWRTFPIPDATQEIGDQFIEENEYAVLKVPSAIVPGDYQYLINPSHPDISDIEVADKEPFSIDISHAW